MSGLVNQTIEGFNSFLNDQKNEKGKAKLTLCLFDGGQRYGKEPNPSYEIIHDGIDIQDVPDLDDKTYVIQGATAMYDAIGSTLDRVKARGEKIKKKNRPDKTIVFIITDGEENSSIEYKGEKVLEMIEERKEKDKWVFLFLGANIDSMKTGGNLGISGGNTLNYSASARGVEVAYDNISTTINMVRSMDRQTIFSGTTDLEALMTNNGAEKEEDLNEVKEKEEKS